MLAEAGDKVVISDDAFGRDHNLRAAIDDVGHHHRVADHLAAAQQLRVRREHPKAVAEQALHQPLLLHRFGEEAHDRRGLHVFPRVERRQVIQQFTRIAQPHAGVVRRHDDGVEIGGAHLGNIAPDIDLLRRRPNRIVGRIDVAVERRHGRLVVAIPEAGDHLDFSSEQRKAGKIGRDLFRNELVLEHNADLGAVDVRRLQKRAHDREPFGENSTTISDPSSSRSSSIWKFSGLKLARGTPFTLMLVTSTAPGGMKSGSTFSVR